MINSKHDRGMFEIICVVDEYVVKENVPNTLLSMSNGLVLLISNQQG